MYSSYKHGSACKRFSACCPRGSVVDTMIDVGYGGQSSVPVSGDYRCGHNFGKHAISNSSKSRQTVSYQECELVPLLTSFELVLFCFHMMN